VSPNIGASGAASVVGAGTVVAVSLCAALVGVDASGSAAVLDGDESAEPSADGLGAAVVVVAAAMEDVVAASRSSPHDAARSATATGTARNRAR